MATRTLRCFLIIVATLASLATVGAQATVSSKFEGTWTDGSVTLKIKFDGPKVKITFSERSDQILITAGTWRVPSYKTEREYFNDGRGEKNNYRITRDATVSVASKTKLEENKLITTTNYSGTVDGKLLTIDKIETWEVASDGSELMLTTVLKGSDKTRTIREVYVRKKS